MSFNIFTTPNFDKGIKSLAKRYRSMKNDFDELKKSLKDNPLQGSDLGGGLRKVRMKITSKGKGKSGGARVITYTLLANQETGEVWLVDIYDKSDYSTAKIDVIKEMLKELNL